MQRGDSVPHFRVQTLDGRPFAYGAVWQHSNLLLVSLAGVDAESAREWVSDIVGRTPELAAQKTALVITRDALPGDRAGRVIVADRWGEIVHIVHVSAAEELPPVQDLLDWVAHVQSRCPECEGEAK